jgi:hypothetical protein
MVQSRQPTRQQANVFINKLEAARRQLDAAIRMTFAHEDELAIHTVAAAAYRILRDMLDKRGRHDLEELYRAGLYNMAKDFIHGKISTDELRNLQLYDLVSAIAEDIRVRGDDITVDEVSLSLSEVSKKAHWQAMSGVSGFLKHADRTPEAVIALKDIDNESLILHASVAYTLVSHTSTPEMAIFYLYWLAADAGRREAVNADQAEVVGYLERLSLSKRRRACVKFIRTYKSGGDLQ